MKKVLVTDDVHPLLMEGIEKLGFKCFFQPDITNEEAHAVIGDYDGLIINSKIMVDKAMLDSGTKLQFVGRVGSGMEIVDKAYAAEKGVAVLSSPEGNRNAVAEHALGMLLALANNMMRSNAEVKNFTWHREKNRGFELMGKTIGIVGFGHTGSAFASKLLGLGMRILTYDKYLPNGYTKNLVYTEGGHFNMKGSDLTNENWNFSTIEEVDLPTIMNESDIVSFHLPLTDEVTYMADAEFFNSCKKNIVLINTSRGKVVKTGDLVEALKNGRVRGACLDVFENEKVSTFTDERILRHDVERQGELMMYSELYGFENVILTPHVAGWTHESKQRLASVLLKRIEKVVK
jgi:D-3-phosphoglycerate dehydrogenase / 2-oxoglutarate reductase